MPEKELPDWTKFGREVRRLRSQAGLSLSDVSSRMNISIGMLSKIERATRAPKRDTVGELDRVLCTNGSLMRRWSDVNRKVADPDWYRRVEDAEAAAVEIRLHNPTLIPGPLQAPEYTREVLNYGRPLDSDADINALLELKAKRAERALSGGDPRLTALVPEMVIRDCVGSPKTASAQLRHLVDLQESGKVTMYVIPRGVPTHISLSTGSFSLISFVDRMPTVFVESASGGELIDHPPREIQRFVSVFGLLQGWALSPADTLGLIREACHGFSVE
ncbi:Scr1 family TA system antitoxin-like transcriptional regulator [Nocardiopsis sediminis]|uniref:Scr1 family TA system antitoxin-like transcriptional regulator n=1 Tax=Nocardiopsis sediminis TaxID=1778267 RepID=A0ABV8FUT8_9ACTN